MIGFIIVLIAMAAVIWHHGFIRLVKLLAAAIWAFAEAFEAGHAKYIATYHEATEGLRP